MKRWGLFEKNKNKKLLLINVINFYLPEESIRWLQKVTKYFYDAHSLAPIDLFTLLFFLIYQFITLNSLIL
ncbi:hypothetical protein SB6411_02806 [Klebsiella spallanzanii]|uniref:Uncharacterized protein n=1 Tax=Klebsiella spallanzanii TaxID=2587528 RepID=A0ABY6VNC9_9ENTR|nr:hypothetical protein SB6411_02806 [Klebsiella spallanzanii]VUS86953.1 hypothetical protein SB6419_04741 [Klebsiella spallanzanii]